MAQHGIRFTVLAPSQAKSVDGEDVSGQRIDPTRAYRRSLPSGRSINLFFYDGPISRAVAFEGLLNNGETLRPAPAGLPSPISATGRNWRTSPPTAKPTAITTVTATWRWPTRSSYIESNGLAKVTNYARISGSCIRPRTTWKFSKTPPGAACTAWDAGAQTAAAIPAATRRLESGMARAAACRVGLAARRSRARL